MDVILFIDYVFIYVNIQANAHETFPNEQTFFKIKLRGEFGMGVSSETDGNYFVH